MNEFELIRRYFRDRSTGPGVLAGIGDDCARVAVPTGHELVLTTDTLIGGRHFPEATPAYDIGWKTLAVNLSDLAAAGATPHWCQLALTLPTADEAWLQDFAAGFYDLADAAGIVLTGGDTTRGPLSLTLTALGLVPSGQALSRRGARPGDGLYVSGTVGDAGLGLQLALGQRTTAQQADRVLARLNQPVPRLTLGVFLRGLATSCIDISDGLLGDLAHIAEESGVGADLAVEDLPLSAALAALPAAEAWPLALSAGDDYELLFTVPDAQAARLNEAPVPVSRIGTITDSGAVRVTVAGQPFSLPVSGFDHFRP